MCLCDRKSVIFRTNTASCALYIKILDLVYEESVSGGAVVVLIIADWVRMWCSTLEEVSISMRGSGYSHVI